ncbi:F-type H+-transporting ATPase subunit delta [Enterococcus sp. PF1-24]|uniref:ATP synthase F1 subunit delta n=1 Tax=unclassified Enterococcus TaxID=2608891 RepID=UPI002475D783|nr:MULTISPECIES: ATP synthase F1 subunit delta [unclassified Enterococcus]MDH6364612.1 F-type H+-transporting ATPase subunit delta [Enterococcus sp. PFB1-1]MDH6401713.1 F-type H+-transporting ATPase subunit delta [Enterococcus sp. PF1-24]
MKLSKFTVGKRYGKALFELAEEKQAVTEIYQELLEVRKIYQLVPDLGNILSDPRLDLAEKNKIMDQLLSAFDGIVHNFLAVVFNYNRMNDLMLMIDEYERHYDEQQGIALGTVTTAIPLTPEQQVALEKEVASFFNYQKATLVPKVDPAILGGVIVEVQHQVIDGSVATKFENMKKLLRK